MGAEQAEKTAQGLRMKAERELSVLKASTFISARERQRLNTIQRTQDISEAYAKAQVSSAFIPNALYD